MGKKIAEVLVVKLQVVLDLAGEAGAIITADKLPLLAEASVRAVLGRAACSGFNINLIPIQ